MTAPTLSLETLADHVGEELGTSGWLEVAQEQVDGFADATGDHQWIHVDPERAAAGPYGGTIAHGYLTLSLLPALVGQAVSVDGVTRRVNYGLDKVRFPSPVPVGSRVRAVVTLASVTPVDGGARVGLSVVVQVEGSDRPACVAQTLTLMLA